MTNRKWVTALFLCQAVLSIISHPMSNRQWVAPLYFIAKQSHQSPLIPWASDCECHFISLPGSSSIMSHPMTNRQWVTLLYVFSRLSHHSCLILWPTDSVWHCFISLPGSYHPMTNRGWVTLLYFFTRLSHQSCLIPWPIESEWHCFIYVPGSLTNHVSSHDQQYVSDTASKQSHQSCLIPMTNSLWVTLLSRTIHQSCLIPWPTVCEWHCFISLPGSLINHVSSHDQQTVSGTTLFLC